MPSPVETAADLLAEWAVLMDAVNERKRLSVRWDADDDEMRCTSDASQERLRDVLRMQAAQIEDRLKVMGVPVAVKPNNSLDSDDRH